MGLSSLTTKLQDRSAQVTSAPWYPEFAALTQHMFASGDYDEYRAAINQLASKYNLQPGAEQQLLGDAAGGYMAQSQSHKNMWDKAGEVGATLGGAGMLVAGAIAGGTALGLGGAAGAGAAGAEGAAGAGATGAGAAGAAGAGGAAAGGFDLGGGLFVDEFGNVVGGSAAGGLGAGSAAGGATGLAGASGAAGTGVDASTGLFAGESANAGAGTYGLGGGGATGLGVPAGWSLTGGAAAAGGSALSRILDGTGGLQDYLGLVGQAAPGVLGYLGSKNQTDSFRQLADQYAGYGAPYRQRLSDLYANPSSFLSSQEVQAPLQQAAGINARALSTGGNPIGSGNAMQAMNDFTANKLFSRLGEEKDRLGGFGGLTQYNAAAPQMANNAIGSQANEYNAIGAGLSNVFNPPMTLAQQFAEFRKYSGGM